MLEITIPWTEHYRPKNLGEIIGNDDAIDKLREWFDSWSANSKKKAALLHGPAGTGKTSSVIALAKERNYELVEMNASDTRNKEAIMQIAGSSSKEGTLSGGAKGKRILLIDEVDGITGQEDRGGLKSLLDVITETSVPIICTANNAYESNLSPLRKISQVIAYQSIHSNYIMKVLKKISREQRIVLELEDLDFIAQNAYGDLRCAINDLQATITQLKTGHVTDISLLKPSRDQTKDIQETLNELFSSKTFLEGKRAINGVNATYDEIILWVFENAHLHVSDRKLAEIYSTLAHADRFLGRISRRQAWGLLSYFFDLVSGGVATSIDLPSKKIQQYVFPQKVGMYAQTRFTRALTDSIAKAVAEKTHVSKHMAKTSFLFLVEEIMKSSIGNAAELAHWLELDENQIKSLVENTDSIKKISKVMKAFVDDDITRRTQIGDLKFSSFNHTGEDWTDILKEWDKKKAARIAEEEKQKEEEKQRKAAERKVKKETNKEGETKTKSTENKVKQQPSLDQFFK